MLLLHLAALSSLFATALQGQPAPQRSAAVQQFVMVDDPVVALTHVAIIDGTGAPSAADQTIVITGGRIRAVGPANEVTIPPGARILTLTNHTVVPGMFGMHDHTFYTTSGGRRTQLNFSAPKLYLASGVTSIRTTGSISPYSEISLKQDIERGEVVGPRMHVSGPYLTGPDLVVERRHITTPDEARRVVNYWADEGATWLKVYTQITRENLRAIVEQAHSRGIKVTGHLCSVGYREAVAAGIDALEHGLLANLEYNPKKQPDQCPSLDYAAYGQLDVHSEPVRATFRDMIEHHVAMTSTLAVFEASVPGRPPIEQRTLDAMSAEVQGEYQTSRTEIAKKGDPSVLALLKKAMEYEVAFVNTGGLLAAGVDPTGNGGALPGFGDQRNYELFIEAGFSAPQAVQILSANGAKVIGVDRDLGTVTVGKLADLIVIDGDPERTPADFKKSQLVFKEGIGYDSAKLIASVKGLVGVR